MLRVSLVCALLLIAGQAHAQIVNVQGQLAKPPDKDGITGQAELKLDWREGNNPIFDIGGAGSVLVRRGPSCHSRSCAAATARAAVSR